MADEEMNESKQATYENIPHSKLLNYVKKTELVAFLTSEKYISLEKQLRVDLKKENILLRDIKKFLAGREDFMTELKVSTLGRQAWTKYVDTVSRMREPALQSRIQAIRKGMTEPTRRFKGCLATKIQPEDYQACLETYDDERYDNIHLVPSGLKKRVHGNTQDKTLKAALGRTIDNAKFSDLPMGFRHYMKMYPLEFKNYFDERKNELAFLKSLVRNLNPQEKDALRDHFTEKKTMSFEDFQSVVVGQKIKNSGKPVFGRGPQKPTVNGGGCGCGCGGGDDDDTHSNASTNASFKSLLV